MRTRLEDFRPRWCYAHSWDCPEGRCPSNCAGLSLWNLNDSVTFWALCEPHPFGSVGCRHTSDNLATKFHHELGLRPTETVLLTWPSALSQMWLTRQLGWPPFDQVTLGLGSFNIWDWTPSQKECFGTTMQEKLVSLQKLSGWLGILFKRSSCVIVMCT